MQLLDRVRHAQRTCGKGCGLRLMCTVPQMLALHPCLSPQPATLAALAMHCYGCTLLTEGKAAAMTAPARHRSIIENLRSLTAMEMQSGARIR